MPGAGYAPSKHGTSSECRADGVDGGPNIRLMCRVCWDALSEEAPGWSPDIPVLSPVMSHCLWELDWT